MLNFAVRVMTDDPKTDKELYQYSLDELKRHIVDFTSAGGITIVIALSRKGPRLLEHILRDELEDKKVVILTEHALPFLFKNLVDLKDEKVQICIVDDAVYFGSTLEGVYHEILAFEDMYSLKYSIKAFAAIKTRTAKEIEGLEVVAHPVRLGYGHYFVKRVMVDIRSSRRPIEVDYPCLTLQLGREANRDALFTTLNTIYNYKVYSVEHDESCSINILLDADNGACFSKLRIYVDGDKLHIAPMSPRMVIDDDAQIRHLFDDADEDISDFWNDVTGEYGSRGERYPLPLRRAVRKTFVTLANFIYSFNTLIMQMPALRQAITNAGSEIIDESINSRDLKYLLMHNELVSDMEYIFSEHLRNTQPLMTSYGINLLSPSEEQVFETYDYPTKDERELLRSHDSQMIFNSEDITQALSAIFFNQNLLIERWSRKDKTLGRDRLYFGYTYRSLRKLLESYHHDFSVKDIDELEIHAWMDKRIEQGCIVPQYIRDATYHAWARVFRPGENEDSVLSHLARWVCWVSRESQQALKMPKIRCKFLEEMLYYLNSQLPELSNELGIQLITTSGDRKLRFIDDSQQIVDLLDYIERMYILHRDGNVYYTLPAYLASEDFDRYTTLSKEMSNSQKSIIHQVVDDFEKFGVGSSSSYLIFNFYYRKQFDYRIVRERIAALASKLNECLFRLRERIKSNDAELLSATERQEVFDCYSGVVPYTVALSVIRGSKKISSVVSNEPEFVETQTRIYKLNMVIGYLMAVFSSKDFDQLSRFADIDDDYYKFVNAIDVKREAEDIVKEGSLHRALTNTTLASRLQAVINK